MTIVPEKTPSVAIEDVLWAAGARHLAGIDEAGRGAWAGPVVAAAVILDPVRLGRLGACVFDSKLLTAPQRANAAKVIRDEALAVGVGTVPVEVIDHAGLAFAGQLAFWRAVKELNPEPDFLLVDGFQLWSNAYRQAAVLQGDRQSLSVAAASIIAKVSRDEFMRDLEESTPGYGFARHKGYGSPAHRLALDEKGVSAHHRRSFRPIATRIMARP
ncbi:MAG: ribonuclease HII [Chloroflexi bacterium]|nr:ribonuclease HII [Chloroflexota bacterium]